ncbi:MAG: hypothetical protein AAFQ58_09400 [Pseudomonadota bacterium]
MKAAIIRDYEAGIEIGEVEEPDLRNDPVVISVRAASLKPSRRQCAQAASSMKSSGIVTRQAPPSSSSVS